MTEEYTRHFTHKLAVQPPRPETYKTEEEGDAYTHGWFDGHATVQEDYTVCKHSLERLKIAAQGQDALMNLAVSAIAQFITALRKIVWELNDAMHK